MFKIVQPICLLCDHDSTTFPPILVLHLGRCTHLQHHADVSLDLGRVFGEQLCEAEERRGSHRKTSHRQIKGRSLLRRDLKREISRSLLQEDLSEKDREKISHRSRSQGEISKGRSVDLSYRKISRSLLQEDLSKEDLCQMIQ